MLKEILSPADCARCRFCCSFRRQSLNLTPCFTNESAEEIRRLYPEARFKTLQNGAITIDLDDNFRNDDSNEEALCYFNRTGCILPPHLKPIECKLWPFRLMRKGDSLFLALVPGCPWIETEHEPKFRSVALKAAKETVEYAKEHPEIITEYSEGYQVIVSLTEEGDVHFS